MNDVKAETRRRAPRSKTSSNEIVYLNFSSGNGAVVLDVSADGLGFQAADAFEPNESLSFRLSVPAFPDIELSGQIVWLDATRKRGGLRLNVPAAVRPLLQSWQAKYLDSASETEEQPSPQAAPPVDRTNGSGGHNHAEPRRGAPPFHPRTFASSAGSHGPMFVSEWEAPPEESHIGRNLLVLGVIIALCLVVAGGSYYIAGKRQMGGLLIHLGRAISGQSSQPAPQNSVSQNSNGAVQNPPPSAIQRDPAAPGPLSPNSPVPSPSANAAALNAPELAQQAPAASPVPPQSGNSSTSGASGVSASPVPSAQPPTANGIRTEAPSSITQDSHSTDALGSSPPSGAPHHTSAAPSNKPSPGEIQLEQARAYLRDSNPADSAIAASLLWSAVEAGNTQAELDLGELYMRGQGAVSKNCAQAEALLTAAQSADIPGATARLQEMQTYGCR